MPGSLRGGLPLFFELRRKVGARVLHCLLKRHQLGGVSSLLRLDPLHDEERVIALLPGLVSL